MNPPAVLFSSSITSLPLLSRGKVRDIYAIDADYLLIVSTDRLSAFDVVLPDPIGGKGRVLTHISHFWFHKMQACIPHHVVPLRLQKVLPNPEERHQVEGRSMIVKRLKPLPVEAIVRGYLAGSGWQDYQQSGAVCGLELPAGLQQAQQLPEAIYTPSSKAAIGNHDENITFKQTVALLGETTAQKVKQISINLYTQAAKFARQKGIIIADTKFEFGMDNNGKLYVIDELLTPDSSRFWSAQHYQVGTNPASFDKQYIRDYLQTLDWNKKAPAPLLPSKVIQTCAAKYAEIEYILTAKSSTNIV